jgi:hypothetical protein
MFFQELHIYRIKTNNTVSYKKNQQVEVMAFFLFFKRKYATVSFSYIKISLNLPRPIVPVYKVRLLQSSQKSKFLCQSVNISNASFIGSCAGNNVSFLIRRHLI